jgi:hypothetical protein
MSPSPPREAENGPNAQNKSRPGPVVAKTDFALAQEVMLSGIGKCKDLDEWLMGSGESAETAESKQKEVTHNINISTKAPVEQPLQTLGDGIDDAPDSEGDVETEKEDV